MFVAARSLGANVSPVLLRDITGALPDIRSNHFILFRRGRDATIHDNLGTRDIPGFI